jgi:hypothetical protein
MFVKNFLYKKVKCQTLPPYLSQQSEETLNSVKAWETYIKKIISEIKLIYRWKTSITNCKLRVGCDLQV